MEDRFYSLVRRRVRWSMEIVRIRWFSLLFWIKRLWIKKNIVLQQGGRFELNLPAASYIRVYSPQQCAGLWFTTTEVVATAAPRRRRRRRRRSRRRWQWKELARRFYLLRSFNKGMVAEFHPNTTARYGVLIYKPLRGRSAIYNMYISTKKTHRRRRRFNLDLGFGHADSSLALSSNHPLHENRARLNIHRPYIYTCYTYRVSCTACRTYGVT